MNGLPYYPRYPRDFFDGTNGMTFELKGAYSMLLDLIYMSGGRLYDEPRFIAGHMNCSVRAWNGYRSALLAMSKISIENEIISNFRADKELIIQRSFRDKQRENGSSPKKNNSLAEAVAKPKASHTDTDTDTERDTTAKAIVSAQAPKPASFLADLASPESIASFMAYRRKTKRAALTVTAAKRLATHLREIFDGGGDPSEALAIAEERGWLTVEPEWYFNAKVKNGKSNRGQPPQSSAFDEIAFAARAR